jgi:hypothetical protein
MQNNMFRKSLVCGILVLFVGVGIVKPGYNLTVMTDKPQYNPGETVRISGRLTENGNGVSGNICINVTDPNEVLIDGICVPTTSEGYFWRNFTLESDVMLGVYHVTAQDEEHDVEASTSFEVVPKIICGDCNFDQSVNVNDVVYLINYLFVPGSPAPVPTNCVADVNNDDKVNVNDVVYLINYLFVPGSPGPSPNCCNPPWK